MTTEATKLQKPNPVKVLKEHKVNLTSLTGAAKERIQTIKVDHAATVQTLTGTMKEKIAQAHGECLNGIQESAKTVAAKDAEVRAAMAALQIAMAEKEKAEVAHETKASGLMQAFNQAAGDIRADVKAQAAAARKARKEAHAAERKKVAEARKAGRSAFIAETKALVDYRVFVVKDTTARVTNGVIFVGKALKTAFNNGYQADSGVKLPESVAKRQAPAETQAVPPAPQA